jgi:putative aldouronate transport system substrate-binding protein
MNKTSKLFSLVCILVLASMLLSACNPAAATQPTSVGNGPTQAATTEPPVTIDYAYLTFNKVPDDTTPVEAAINAITVPKINVKVKLHPYSIASYFQQINLSLQSGEGLDVFHSLGDMPQNIAQNKVLDITNLIDKDAPEAKAVVGDNLLKAAMANGKLYGIPAYKGYALAPNLVYRADIMKDIGVDPATIKSIKDLTDVFAKVKAKYPDMVPLVPASSGSVGILPALYGVDYLGDDPYNTKNVGVLVGNNMKVVDLFEAQEFKDSLTLVRDWYKNGYILKDAATTTSNSIELMSSGKGFSFIASYSGTQAYSQISAQTGRDIKMVRLAQPYLTTSAVNAVTWVIASTSKHPDAALKFLNLTFSDKDVINLIIYGIEGQDYVKVDADHVKYPDGKDATSVPYTAQLTCGIAGNQFIQYTMQGTDMADLQLWDKENKSSALSPAFGFTFDNSSVTNEVTAIVNVINQYLPGLITGTTDPAVELPNFVAKLKEVGMDKVIAVKQTQLDQWVAAQKK